MENRQDFRGTNMGETIQVRAILYYIENASRLVSFDFLWTILKKMENYERTWNSIARFKRRFWYWPVRPTMVLRIQRPFLSKIYETKNYNHSTPNLVPNKLKNPDQYIFIQMQCRTPFCKAHRARTTRRTWRSCTTFFRAWTSAWGCRRMPSPINRYKQARIQVLVHPKH